MQSWHGRKNSSAFFFSLAEVLKAQTSGLKKVLACDLPAPLKAARIQSQEVSASCIGRKQSLLADRALSCTV